MQCDSIQTLAIGSKEGNFLSAIGYLKALVETLGWLLSSFELVKSLVPDGTLLELSPPLMIVSRHSLQPPGIPEW